MEHLTDQQIIEFFKRSYKASDGLWFMKVEEKYGFNAALEIDKEVWKVMPKIQARMIKAMLRKSEGEAALLKSLTTKLTLEDFKFKVEQKENGFQIQISDCPWHNLMVKSVREKYSEKVGTAICNIEYSVWTSEFDENTQFTLRTQKCKGSKHCLLTFNRR
ncbi:L-2-amino-thiazoline-4-carboxylic acid hydrolase [Candidatus Bathyarchaeota archaeon]|nr:L-2-amino-thiazoline-4-carboxylic acid hydrolase [Candidatus Bathyarchaeota archaeon]